MKTKTMGIIYTLSALVFSFSLPVQAADVANYSNNGTVAEATFDGFGLCDNDLAGIRVAENVIKDGPGGPQRISEVSVFGNFMFNCDIPTLGLFYGSFPLNPGEFTQNGISGATLVKTINVMGYDVSINLTWNSKKELLNDHTSFNNTSGDTRTITHHYLAISDANIAGSYSVNGPNGFHDYVTESFRQHGTLSVEQTKTISITK